MITFKCAICGKGLTGTYYTTEHSQRYCGSHVDPPRCRYCLHLLRQGGSEPCPQCMVSGFSNSAMAQSSIAQVASWIEEHIGAHALLHVPIKMTEGIYFSPNQSGLTNWRYDGMKLDIEIEMLKLSQAHIFEPTLAHEYGHVILVANPSDLSFTGGIGQARLQEEEGFCEVLRYLWVLDNKRGNNDLELKAITENVDPLYGDGFRMMWPRYKAAGSIMNLRADLLGISYQPSGKTTSWQFGKKKKPSNQPQLPSPVIDSSMTPQHVAPNSPIPNVMEGGSHRPMIDLGRDKTIMKSPTAAPVSQDEQRPTIDFTPTPTDCSLAQPVTPNTADEDRPIIRFD